MGTPMTEALLTVMNPCGGFSPQCPLCVNASRKELGVLPACVVTSLYDRDLPPVVSGERDKIPETRVPTLPGAPCVGLPGE